MDKNKSLGDSIKLNLKHKLQVNPSEDNVKDKPVRGSDVPLFWGKGKENLGMEIKTVYNRCMNLLAFKPKVMPKHPLAGSKLEANVIKLIKELKHNKEDYSSAWKKNFKKYKHTLKNTHLDYNDKDPFDDFWMKHELLEQSIEMQEAAADYLQKAEVILAALDETMRSIEHNLKEIAAGNSMTLDDWAQRGENSVVYKLARAQEKVDKILLEEWKPVTKSLGDLHQGIHPSYIGSTNTGQKSITKAYVQFNPNDFDVDGQLKASMLYMALDDLKMSASKGRFFVRQVGEKALEAAVKILGTEPHLIPPEEKKRLKQLENLLIQLMKYVDRVENRITSEIRGVMKDPEDPFDLAIVLE